MDAPVKIDVVAPLTWLLECDNEAFEFVYYLDANTTVKMNSVVLQQKMKGN